MPDYLNELGKNLGQTEDDVSHALTRPLIQTPLVERARDIFDATIPFEMVFDVPSNLTTYVLDLLFMPPPIGKITCCCGGCYCSICEYYTSGTVYTTTYPYYSSSVHVYSINAATGYEQLMLPEDGQYVLTNSTTVTSTIGSATPAFPIKICYAYRIPDCVSG